MNANINLMNAWSSLKFIIILTIFLSIFLAEGYANHLHFYAKPERQPN